jgi:tetratricopeptide (TPR) repeat protein
MSPEQAAGRLHQIDIRTDVYALGVVLFRLLTGDSPHGLSGTRYEVLRRIAEEEVRRPREIAKDVDRELEALLLKALARDPKDRYASAGVLAQDMDNYLSGEPLAARPPTTAYFLRKRLWKYRGRVAIASAFLVVLMSVALMAYLGVVRAEKLASERLHESQRTRKALEDKAESEREVYNIVREALDRMIPPSVSPLDTLEEAERELQIRFADRSEVQAAAHVEIGKVCLFLEEFEHAEEQFHKALPILERELGMDHRDSITARGFLLIALHRLGKIDEWRLWAEQQLLSRLEKFGRTHPDTVRSMGDVATARWRSGDLQGAAELGKPILEIQGEVDTITDPDELTVTERLALLLTQIGKFDEAQDLLKRAVEIREDLYGKEDTGTLSAKSALAFLLLRSGDRDGARAINKEIFETRSRLQGETDPDTQWAKSNMDVLLKGYPHPATVAWTGDVLADDDFEGRLTLPWEILNPDPSHFSLTKNPGALTITTQEGEFSRSESGYENLFLIPCPTAPGDDFQVTTCVRGFHPVAMYNQAGLICYNNDDNYLKSVYEWHTDYHTGRVFTVAFETGDRYNHLSTLAPLEFDDVWLRIAKKGNQYWFATSLDGKRYDPIGCLQHDTTGLFQGHVMWGDGAVARVGLFANNSSHFEAPEIDACFDFFEVRSLSAHADQVQNGASE